MAFYQCTDCLGEAQHGQISVMFSEHLQLGLGEWGKKCKINILTVLIVDVHTYKMTEKEIFVVTFI